VSSRKKGLGEVGRRGGIEKGIIGWRLIGEG
jgi:hypothetical protein